MDNERREFLKRLDAIREKYVPAKIKIRPSVDKFECDGVTLKVEDTQIIVTNSEGDTFITQLPENFVGDFTIDPETLKPIFL